MKNYYNLLFVGLRRLAKKTTYEEISEYIAAWGMALIIEINFIIFIGAIGIGDRVLKAYFLIPLYIFLIIVNVRYFNNNIQELETLEKVYSSKESNVNLVDGLALFFIIESALCPLVFVAI